MKNADEIYRTEVRRMTATDRLRLARLILNDLSIEPTLRDTDTSYSIGNSEEEIALEFRGTGLLNPPLDDLG